MKLQPTLPEARQIALFFYRSCLMGSVVIGALVFFTISLLLLSDPLFLFPSTIVGAVFGWHMVLPMFGIFFLRDLDAKVPGLGDATLMFFRNAQPGAYLDMKKLAAQVGARNRHAERGKD